MQRAESLPSGRLVGVMDYRRIPEGVPEMFNSVLSLQRLPRSIVHEFQRVPGDGVADPVCGRPDQTCGKPVSVTIAIS